MEPTLCSFRSSLGKVTLPPALQLRAVCLGFVIWCALALQIQTPWYVAVLFTAMVIVGARKIRYTFVVLVALGCALALLRTNLQSPGQIFSRNFLGPQAFTAAVVDVPRPGDKVTRYVVEPQGWGGRVLLIVRPLPHFEFGDEIQVDCPQIKEEEFSAYQAQGIRYECAFPNITLRMRAKPSLRGALIGLRNAASTEIQVALAEPYASLATGMLWGDDAGLPRELTTAFKRTGTTHLLAVSGYNVMVLTTILFTVLLSLGLWRTYASIVVGLLVVAFVVFTGAEPAVVRAGIMGCVVVVARLLGRKADTVNLLLATAVAMLAFEPSLVRNLGFQLSFAAMAGLTLLSPVLATKLNFLPVFFGLRESVAQTLAATLTTTPIIFWWVGQVAVLSPLVNLAVGPVVVLVFSLGLPLVVLTSVNLLVLAQPVAWALTFILWYVVTVVRACASLPWSAVTSIWGGLVLVVVYLGFIRWLFPRVFKSQLRV